MSNKGKGKKKGSKSNDNKSKKNKKPTTKATRKSEGKSKGRCNVDIFNENAMENAYYTCHNVQDVLKCRGFPWPDAQKKKSKGKRK